MTLDPRLLATLMSAALGVIAAAHAAWGLGGLGPRRDRSGLARAVIGRETMPGPAACFAVALALAAVAAVPLLMAAIVITPLPWDAIQTLGLGVALIFALRGLAGYLPAFDRRFGAQPFATLNRLFYSPLCLAFAAGFVALEFCYPR